MGELDWNLIIGIFVGWVLSSVFDNWRTQRVIDKIETKWWKSGVDVNQPRNYVLWADICLYLKKRQIRSAPDDFSDFS